MSPLIAGPPKASNDPLSGNSTVASVAGVSGTSVGVGIYGAGDEYAGQFEGNVLIDGGLVVHSESTIEKAVFLGNDLHVTGDVTIGQTLGVEGSLEVNGTLSVKVDIILEGADFAEHFEVASGAEIESGTVMVLTAAGTLEPSGGSYDKKVAGIVSGAGDLRPGIILGVSRYTNMVPVALSGTAYCKADAQFSPIAIGDLLTTSPTSGHAMKATDPFRSFGAVLGKAMRPLHEGRGLIPVLVALQ